MERLDKQPDYLLSVLIFLVFGGFIGASAYVAFIPPTTRITLKIMMVAITLIAWTVLARIDRFVRYRALMGSFFAISLGVLISHYFAPFTLDLLGLAPVTARGVAIAKFSEAFPIVVSILIYHFATAGDRQGLYLATGNRRIGVIAAILGMGIFLGIAVVQSIGSGLQWATVLTALPWILIFTLSNAFLEELWFRATFLKKLEPMVGMNTAIVITSLVFGAVHISSTYVRDILLFVPVTILLGLIWAWLMHRSKSIWSPVLIHAAGDVLVMIGLLAGTN